MFVQPYDLLLWSFTTIGLRQDDLIVELQQKQAQFSSSPRIQVPVRNDGGGRKEEVTSQARTPLHLLKLSKLDLAHFQQLIPSLL